MVTPGPGWRCELQLGFFSKSVLSLRGTKQKELEALLLGLVATQVPLSPVKLYSLGLPESLSASSSYGTEQEAHWKGGLEIRITIPVHLRHTLPLP
jgi:hypothetical protein